MFLYEDLPFAFAKLGSLLARKPEAYPLYEFLQALMCFAVMFGPTVCLGMTLPLVSRIATAELSQTGHAVGRVFAINTLGTVLGAAVTGLWLLPALGLARTFAVGVAANALIAGLVLWRGWPVRRIALAGLALAATGWVWVAGAWFARWPQALTLGLWRDPNPPAHLSAYRDRVAENHLLFHRDGAGATVTINTIRRKDGVTHRRLVVNGKVDAATFGDISTQLLLGHLPMLLRPASADVLRRGESH